MEACAENCVNNSVISVGYPFIVRVEECYFAVVYLGVFLQRNSAFGSAAGQGNKTPGAHICNETCHNKAVTAVVASAAYYEHTAVSIYINTPAKLLDSGGACIFHQPDVGLACGNGICLGGFHL